MCWAWHEGPGARFEGPGFRFCRFIKGFGLLGRGFEAAGGLMTFIVLWVHQ